MGHAIRALGPILARLGSGFLASAQAALHAALAFGRGLLQGVLKSFQLLGQGLMWVARVVIPLVGRAMVWLGRIFLLNPIGLALTLLATAATLFYTRWEGIKGGFLILCQQISEAFTGLWARIRPAFSGGLAGIAALILNWSPLGLFYRAFAGVLSWFGVELPARFTDYGRMLVEGLINGIGGAVGWLIEKAKSLGGSVSDAVKSALGIASPSKVMMEIGGFAMQGLELGMAGGQEGPLSIISRLSGDILSAIRAPLANLGNLMVMPPLQPMPALAGAGGGPRLANGNQMSAPSAGLTVNIVVNPAPGMDEKKLAELVTQKLKEAQLGKEARARSRLADSD
jgi:phage-related protein